MIKKTAPEKTYASILRLLKKDGPQDAIQLAQQLNVTDMAVRQHLYALEKSGDICNSTTPRPKGRPAKLWQLTDKAYTHFPNTHAEFSTGLISSIVDVFGHEGMEKLLDSRLNKQVAEYSQYINPEMSLKDKLESLSTIRTREGYMANIVMGNSENDFLFVENNCPVCEAAKACSGICARELDLLQEILGQEVKIFRSEMITQGARRCAYQISMPGK
ncbi:MAG: transcriptional regulator [Emcibacter sp.]|nr:transcriptional regulator [Emcibacter sp.]